MIEKLIILDDSKKLTRAKRLKAIKLIIEFKQNKFTPVTRIVIKNDNELARYKKIACLILSWNISDIIVKKIKKINRNIKFIKT